MVWLGSLPKRCLLCQHWLSAHEHGICDYCFSEQLTSTQRCLGCFQPLALQPPLLCSVCRRNKQLLVVHGVLFHSQVGFGVAAFKRYGQFAWLMPLCRILALRLRSLWQSGLLPMVDAIAPVPASHFALKKRGFNQSKVIALTLGHMLGLPVVDLFQAKFKRSQQGLTRSQRLTNLKGVFSQQKTAPQRLAIVDDVVTTGATAQSLVQLVEKDCEEIQVWVLARTQTQS